MNLYTAVKETVTWLDKENGTEPAELAYRVLKISEELGEATGAFIGAVGQNPRKGLTHTYLDVASELGDVVFTALVAIASLGYDPNVIMQVITEKITNRIGKVTRNGNDSGRDGSSVPSGATDRAERKVNCGSIVCGDRCYWAQLGYDACKDYGFWSDGEGKWVPSERN